MLFAILTAGFFWEIQLLNKTSVQGHILSIFVYIGLLLVGLTGVGFAVVTSNASIFNEETKMIVLMALLIGAISVMNTSWKVDIAKRIPVSSSGIIFGMLSVFHVLIESFVRGYIMWNLVFAAIMMCIAIVICFDINMRSALTSAIFYCIFTSILRNIEFLCVQTYNVNPFFWMVVISIPAIVIAFSTINRFSNSSNWDNSGKQLAILWIFLPTAYHFVIITISPTIAALSVTIGYTIASVIKSEDKRKTIYAAASSLIASGLVAFG